MTASQLFYGADEGTRTPSRMSARLILKMCGGTYSEWRKRLDLLVTASGADEGTRTPTYCYART